MTDLLLKALLSYLLGSVSGSMVVGAFRHVDIRKSGSGNAGGTNAFRTQGFWFALGVVIVDIGRAPWLPGGCPPSISGCRAARPRTSTSNWLAVSRRLWGTVTRSGTVFGAARVRPRRSARCW